jgi:hypothetical protein
MLARSSIPDVSAMTPMRVALLVLCVLLFSVNATLFGVAIYTHVTYSFISAVLDLETMEAVATGLGIALSVVTMTAAMLGTWGVIKDKSAALKAATCLLMVCAVVAASISGLTTPAAAVVNNWINGTDISTAVPSEVSLMLNLVRYECRGLGSPAGGYPISSCVNTGTASYLKSKYAIKEFNNTWTLKELPCSKITWLSDTTNTVLNVEGQFNALVLGGVRNALGAVSAVCIISILIELALFGFLIALSASDAASDVLGVVLKSYRTQQQQQQPV